VRGVYVGACVCSTRRATGAGDFASRVYAGAACDSDFRNYHGSNGFQTCASEHPGRRSPTTDPLRRGCCRGCRLTRTGRRTHACPPHARAAPRGRHVPRMRTATRASTQHPPTHVHSPPNPRTHPPTHTLLHPPARQATLSMWRPCPVRQLPLAQGWLRLDARRWALLLVHSRWVGACVNVFTCLREGANAHQGTRRANAHVRNTQPTAPTCIESPAHAPPHPRAHAPTPPCSRRLRARDREREREREPRSLFTHTHTDREMAHAARQK